MATCHVAAVMTLQRLAAIDVGPGHLIGSVHHHPSQQQAPLMTDDETVHAQMKCRTDDEFESYAGHPARSRRPDTKSSHNYTVVLRDDDRDEERYEAVVARKEVLISWHCIAM